MYDGFLLGESMDLIDPVEYEVDRFCLDSDKFTGNLHPVSDPFLPVCGRDCKQCFFWSDSNGCLIDPDEEELEAIEEGADSWLLGALGIL